MKTILITLLLLFLCVNAYSQKFPRIQADEERNFFEIRDRVEAFYDTLQANSKQDLTTSYGYLPGYKQFKRWENFWKNRVSPTGEFPNTREIYEKYIADRINSKKDRTQSSVSSWNLIGPSRDQVNKLQSTSYGVGRVNVIEFNPDNPMEVFIGSAGGGVWKSTNGGNNWNIIENTDLMSVGIADIEIARSNTNTIYVATGDNNGSFMTGVYSIGVLKSTDGGETFQLTSNIYDRGEGAIVHRVIVHPLNEDLVLISTNRGIYKSNDGGDNWSATSMITTTGDLEFHYSNPNLILACLPQKSNNTLIYKSEDFGENWTEVLNAQGHARTEIEFSQSNPNIVYAQGANKNGAYAGIYFSDDFGETWTLKSTTPNIHDWSVNGGGATGQGTYNIAMAVHPINPYEVYAGGVNMWKSLDGGETWDIISHWWGQNGIPFSHADHHFMVFQPGTNNLYVAKDGGIGTSANRGNSWERRNMGLSIMQFYGISHSKNHQNILLGGSQDNGSVLYRNGSWYTVWGGDGMECIIDYKNPDVLYVTNPYGALSKSTNGGNDFRRYVFSPAMVNEYSNWVTPLKIHPTDNNTLYIGYVNLWKSPNGGDVWQKLTNINQDGPIDALEISDNYPNYIYFSKNRNLFRSTDGGSTWTSLGFANGIISDIEINEEDPTTAWISLSGFTNNKIYFYDNSDFVNLSSNLPAVPVNTIQKQYLQPEYLFAGTDIGVYFYSFETQNWEVFKEDLPPVIVSDIIIDESKKKIFAGTYARGIWETDLTVCNVSKPKIIKETDLAICEGDSVMLSIEDNNYKQIKWSNGDSGPFTYAKKNGDYFVIVKDEFDCVSMSEKVKVKVMDFSELKIQKSANSFCVSDEIEITVDNDYVNYLWSTGENGKTITVNEPGEYWVEVENEAGCIYRTDPIVLEENGLERVPRVLGKSNICDGESTYIYLDQYYSSLEWNTGAIGDSLEVSQEGEYYATVFDENGCSSVTEKYFVNVFDNEKPKINYSGMIEQGLCEGDAANLTSDGKHETIMWSTGDTTAEISVTENGDYFYKAISNNGCIFLSDTVFIEFHDLPEEPEIYRSGDSIFVNEPDDELTYQWLINSQVISAEKGGDQPAIAVEYFGEYQVEAQSEFGCVSRSNIVKVVLSVEQYYEGSTFRVKPNPSSGEFLVFMEGITASKANFELTDMSGRKVKSYKFNNINDILEFKIDLSGSSNGVYYLSINIDGNYFLEKLIKRN